MNSRLFPVVIALLVLNLGATTFVFLTREDAPATKTKANPLTKSERDAEVAKLSGELDVLRSQMDSVLLGQPADAPSTPLNDRLDKLERNIAKLGDRMDGVSIEGASEERAKLFIGENGHLKADEYFEAGKFAIAGEGYLAFLEAHPDHPDHRSILERARDAFSKAKYKDKAIWVQEGLIEMYPENKGRDYMTLAHMERDRGNYDVATRHAEESAANLTTSQRYWSRLYAAWYTELDQGLQAGLDYHLNVQREIHDAGLGDTRLGIRAQEKIDEIRQQLAAPALSSTK